MNMNPPSSLERKLPKVALIAGPTASGKSALALKLAERVGGIIVNADSAQVYRDLRILSARPSPREEQRAPHRLYGYRDGEVACSAADWAIDAKAEISKAHSLGQLPILVGGTGLYVRTLLEGIAPVPEIDPDIRAEVRALALEDAYSALSTEDPETAGRLGSTDKSRIARALEVIRSTGRPLVKWQNEKTGGIGKDVSLAPLILLPPREWLYERCDRRFEEMIGPEGVEEARLLMKRGLNPALPVMRAIGVPQIAAFLGGELSREETLLAGRTATRQYAKRQYTWFSRQPPSEWPRFTSALDSPDQIEAALLLLGERRQIA
jgi:tRNA dimethylallyltransferase